MSKLPALSSQLPKCISFSMYSTPFCLSPPHSIPHKNHIVCILYHPILHDIPELLGEKYPAGVKSPLKMLGLRPPKLKRTPMLHLRPRNIPKRVHQFIAWIPIKKKKNKLLVNYPILCLNPHVPNRFPAPYPQISRRNSHISTPCLDQFSSQNPPDFLWNTLRYPGWNSVPQQE